MHVAFVASEELVRTVVAGGFEALPPEVAARGDVLVTEVDPTLTGTLDGNAAVVLEIPDDLASSFARTSGEDGEPRTYALPVPFADRLPVLAYRLEGPAAAPAVSGPRRLPRGLAAAAAVVLAVCVGVALYLVLDDDSEDAPNTARQERAASSQPAERPEQPPEAPAPPPRPASRAVGTPESGRLVNGVAVPAEGKHFFTWNIPEGEAPNPRSRRYGTDGVVARLRKVAAAYGRAHPDAPRVGIADLSLRRGGFFGTNYGGSGHVGHQNGTEADVLYPRKDGKERAADSLGDVDRRLTQDLLDRFLAGGALSAVVDPRLGLKAPAGRLGYQPLHEEHIHLRFPAR